jgi:hypothetical protein
MDTDASVSTVPFDDDPFPVEGVETRRIAPEVGRSE